MKPQDIKTTSWENGRRTDVSRPVYANEMRTIALAKRKENLCKTMDEIYFQIECHSEKGYLETIFFDTKRMMEFFSKEIIADLKRKGYKLFIRHNGILIKW